MTRTRAAFLAVTLSTLLVQGCGSGGSSPTSPTPNPTYSIIPVSVTLTSGESATFEIQGTSPTGQAPSWSAVDTNGKLEFTRQLVPPQGYQISVTRVLMPGSQILIRASYDSWRTVAAESRVTLR